MSQDPLFLCKRKKEEKSGRPEIVAEVSCVEYPLHNSLGYSQLTSEEIMEVDEKHSLADRHGVQHRSIKKGVAMHDPRGLIHACAGTRQENISTYYTINDQRTNDKWHPPQ